MGHPFKSIGIDNHDIGDGEWEFVFRTGCIEITVVDANPYLPILLEDGDNVGYPIWMLFLPDEATRNELVNFSFNSFYNVRAKSTLLLLDWLDVGLDV